MIIDFNAHVEMTLDNFKTRIEALEKALTQVSYVEQESDPSHLPGVKINAEALAHRQSKKVEPLG